MSDEVTPEEFEVPSTVEEILDERSESEQQRDEYKDALQRLQADFENYKKRVARTSEEVVTRAVADVVAKLLPVLDALDLAQAHFTNADTSELDSAEAKALIQARGLLLDTLKKEGLDRVDAAGVSFDPQIHDAVMHIEGDGSGGQIVDDILRAGYQWKGTVVRPAMVRVKG
ncbi:MAG: nucleotide exchange factor GrpE [Actinomycetes bacterium]